MKMLKIGVSFESTLAPGEFQEGIVRPLASSLLAEGLGIYTDHLEQTTGRHAAGQPITEHLLVFEVQDFQLGLRHVRTNLQQSIGSEELRFHNLSDNSPLY